MDGGISALGEHAGGLHSKPDRFKSANAIVRRMLGTPADAAIVLPATRVAGRIRVPGDKSISHRYAMLAALADGPSTLHGYASGADCAATLACLTGLGVAIRRHGADVTIEGRGLRGLAALESC